MKRDFQEEYQNYIESDMPDLWSRIEPNLKEKNGRPEEDENQKREEEGNQKQEEEQKKAKQAKVIYFLKRAVPAAACLCVLIIGISVMRVSKRGMDMAPMESAKEETNDAGMAYEMEEMADEPVEESAADECVMTDESFDDADVAMNESAAPAEAPSEDMEEENDEVPFSEGGVQSITSKTDPTGVADKNQTQAAATGSLTETAEGTVEIERAVLLKIAVASEEMQEMGYEYAYTFRLEDGSSLKVYLTKEQCDDIEDKGIEIKRKEAYSLKVYPFKNPETDSNAESGEGFLEKIEKLP